MTHIINTLLVVLIVELAAVLWAAEELGANHVQMLRYATSGDVTGDYDQVVGYAAAVLTRV